MLNSLDPDQAQQNVVPDLDPNCLYMTLVGNIKFIHKMIQTVKSKFQRF